MTQKENGKTVRYAFSVPGWDTWYYDPWLVNGGGTILTSDMKKNRLWRHRSHYAILKNSISGKMKGTCISDMEKGHPTTCGKCS